MQTPLSTLMDSISRKFTLNEQQQHAYHIISLSVLNRDVFHLSEWKHKPPLRMLLTGPGGTGKSHVVHAVRELMTYFGLAHTIRFMAPTGSAAKLINGTTVHSGLDSTEDHSVLVSIKNQQQLRDEWKDVLLLLLDEVSLVDQALIAEIDAAL
ncbi:hypothetical protein F5878DRAFT_544224, partial [Lentinula raphanica]